MIYLTSLPDYKNNFNVNGNTIVSEGVYKRYFLKKKDILLNFTGNSRSLTRIKKVFFSILVLFLKNKNNNSIYTTLDDNYGFYLQISFLKLASYIYNKIIIHHHSFTYISKKSNLFKLLSSKKFIHISISKTQNEFLKKKYKLKNIHLIKNNAFIYDKLIFNKKFKKKLKVIYFSALTKEKGIYDFLNLTKAFYKKNIDFYIFGNNCTKQVLYDLKQYKKDNIIKEYKLNIYNKSKEAIFKSSDILIFPSQYKSETTPLVIDECINFQVVPIAYDIGDIKRQLEGMNLMVNNFKNLKNKLNHVLLNYKSYKKKIILLKKKKLKRINIDFKDFDKVFLLK